MKRRDFITLSVKSAMAAGFTSSIPAALLRSATSHAALLATGLSDPALQPLFRQSAPNPLNPGFRFTPFRDRYYLIKMAQTVQMTGLVGADGQTPVPTTVWGYGDFRGNNVSWPGKTLELHVDDDPIDVVWFNLLYDFYRKQHLPHLLPVDKSLHWAFSLPDYQHFSMEEQGVPLVTHVHGGSNDSISDGNPEFFYTPFWKVRGPRWRSYFSRYGGQDWNRSAGTLWYHDHALGITRLNVYAGLAGYFIVRDSLDTGQADNPMGLPAAPYEIGFAIQDRMFRNDGQLFYPAFPGDPAYADFITNEGAILPEDQFPGGGPTALAEFFGDHMVVNGLIWPKYSVEPRQYRVRLLNGCDSRFMRLRLRSVSATETDPTGGSIVPFYIIGSDQSLRPSPVQETMVDFAPGERLDLVIDFKQVTAGSRVIIENLLGDAPFGGDLPDVDDLFPDRRTDRIMAFDVELPFDSSRMDTDITEQRRLYIPPMRPSRVDRTRKLGLFEGSDEYGRLQPLLGTAEPVIDVEGNTVQGALPWSAPITENPDLGDSEIWEIYNATGDAHPIHVHLVDFEVLNREGFTADIIEQPIEQHNGTLGVGFRLENIVTNGQIREPEAAELTKRDVVTALPGEVTRIHMRFLRPGRYVWHCHILSHEDHEMMRPFYVGPIRYGD